MADLIGSGELARRAGITYPRLETLRRNGIITPEGPCAGIGHERSWSPEMIPVARMATRLTDAGLTLKAAGRVLASGESRAELGSGIWVSVDCGTVAEEIARAIEASMCAPGEQCAERFCPDCVRHAQCQADAATARRIGGAS